MFYNNYKWSINFKNCEPLYCTPVTYVILYSNYTSIQKRFRSILTGQQWTVILELRGKWQPRVHTVPVWCPPPKSPLLTPLGHELKVSSQRSPCGLHLSYSLGTRNMWVVEGDITGSLWTRKPLKPILFISWIIVRLPLISHKCTFILKGVKWKIFRIFMLNATGKERIVEVWVIY